MPPTVDGFLLLGWMEREEAVHWLTNDCWFEPAITSERAAETWERYKLSVDGLPQRKPVAPKRHPIPASSRSVVDNFLQRTRGPEVLDVINIDPRELFVYQLYVVADRANHHAQHLRGDQWHRNCLQIDRPNNPMPLRIDAGSPKGLATGKPRLAAWSMKSSSARSPMCFGLLGVRGAVVGFVAGFSLWLV